MLKGILLAAILLAGAGAGRMLSNARRRRFELLGELLAAMRVLRLRMLNSAEPLSVLLRKSDSRLFRDLGNGLWEGGGLRPCWEKLRQSGVRRGCMLDCLNQDDLLLLDDLGAEPMIENVTINYLYYLINERLCAGKAMIVSTNFMPDELREAYTERVSSRLMDQRNTQVLHFVGTDVRR